MPREIGRTPEETKFWSDVECNAYHWYWVGDPDLEIEYLRDKAWTYVYAPILEGWHVDLWCDEEFCVRPQHMFIGKIKDISYAIKRRQLGVDSASSSTLEKNRKFSELSQEELWKIDALIRRSIPLAIIARTFHVPWCGVRRRKDEIQPM